MRALVIDVGTSGVRASVVGGKGRIEAFHYERVLPASPAPGFVEVDASHLAAAALRTANACISELGAPDAVAIAAQRATTVVWDRASGVPIGPALGWQDLRTVGMCLALAGQGIRLAPNQSATKVAALLDIFDAERRRDLCFGTVDAWIAWTLSLGAAHVTDATNAGVTGLVDRDAAGWDRSVLEALRVPQRMLPTIVDSSGHVADAAALPGAPPIVAIVGDQQASLVGQGCTEPGLAKITFGTGGMLDCCVGPTRPGFERIGDAGTFPIVAWRHAGRSTWGVEAIMLSAGTAVDWLVEDLGILASAAESDELAATCADTGDVWFVPALVGLGTPRWDFGARGLLLGLTRGTGRAELARAVLEGVAHRGADLLEATEADTGLAIASLRVDGGMSGNATFLQALADATQRTVEVSPEREATTVGAAYLAGLAVGEWRIASDLAELWRPRAIVEPRRRLDRDRWRDARQRAERTMPELSGLDFF